MTDDEEGEKAEVAEVGTSNTQALITKNDTSSLLSSAPVPAKEFFQIPEIILQQFSPQEELHTLKAALKFAHKSLLHCINYFELCESQWLENTLNAINKSFRDRSSSLKLVKTFFTHELHEFEQKSGSIRTPGTAASTTAAASNAEEDALSPRVRSKYYSLYLEELRAVKKSGRLIESDIEKYLKFLQGVYFNFLNGSYYEDYEEFNSAMKSNSKIITQWVEEIMGKKITFHFKALREFRLNVINPSEVDNYMVLHLLDNGVRKAAEDFVNTVERTIHACHSYLDSTVTEALGRIEEYKKTTYIDLLSKVITDLFLRTEAGILKELESKVAYRQEHESSATELRNRLNIPPVAISLEKKKEEGKDADENSSSSETYSIIGRTFGVQKIYETQKSSIIGRDLPHLLKKTKVYLKQSLKQIKDDNLRMRSQAFKTLNEKSQVSLTKNVLGCVKTSKEELEQNRYRAEMYVHYKLKQEVLEGRGKNKSIRKYVRELSLRTRLHYLKVKSISKLFLQFFQRTTEEYSLLRLQSSVSDFGSFTTHKEQVCKSILRVSQKDFSFTAELAHSQLLLYAKELEMRSSLSYGIGEFVKGMKWIDHNFIKTLVDSSADSFQSLRNFNDSRVIGEDRLTELKANNTSSDIQQVTQVIKLYFAGFLKSQALPEQTEENIVERLRTISDDTAVSSSEEDSANSSNITFASEPFKKDRSVTSHPAGHNNNEERQEGQIVSSTSTDKGTNTAALNVKDSTRISIENDTFKSRSTPGVGFTLNNCMSNMSRNLNPGIFIPEKDV